MKLASHLKSKLGVGNYDFAVSIFTLPSSRALSPYHTLDVNTQHGIIYQTLEQMNHEFNNRPEPLNKSTNPNYERWKRICILKCDETKIREKSYNNPHTHDILGFENGAYDIDVLMKEMSTLDSNLKKLEVEDNTNDNKNKRNIPNVTQHALLFMISR